MDTITITAVELVEEMGRIDPRLVELAAERIRGRKLEAVIGTLESPEQPSLLEETPQP